MEESGCQYRSGRSTLQQRTRKKLTGKEDWFRKTKKRERDEFDEEDEERSKKRRKRDQEEQQAARIVSVMFVPYTRGGELARRLREVEEQQGKLT